MTECEYNHAGFCELEGGVCGKQDEYGYCTAKEEDLIEYCEDCDKPFEECDCGTNLVLVSNSKGEVLGFVTQKKFHELKLIEEVSA